MEYNFDKKINRYGTNSIKWEKMDVLSPYTNKNTIPMWVADMDFACPPEIIEALHTRVDKEIFGYSSHETSGYFDAVSNWIEKRFNYIVKSDDIFISHGVVPAINNLICAMTKKGDGIIIQRPVYYPFSSAIEDNDRKIVNNKLINNDGYYTIDFEDLEIKAKDKNNKMMIFSSPHNPVGRVWTEEELKKVGKICIENNIILISDEIHFDLIRTDKKHTIISSLFPENDEIILCTAPSKTFNIAGLQVSNIIIRNKNQKKLWEKQVGNIHLNPFAIVAVEAAYNKCEDWVKQVNEYIDENMKYIDNYVKNNLKKAKSFMSEGTYLTWIDFNGYNFSKEELDDLMIKSANVLFDMGHMFGPEGNGFIRINVACPKSTIVECMDRINSALKL